MTLYHELNLVNICWAPECLCRESIKAWGPMTICSSPHPLIYSVWSDTLCSGILRYRNSCSGEFFHKLKAHQKGHLHCLANFATLEKSRHFGASCLATTHKHSRNIPRKIPSRSAIFLKCREVSSEVSQCKW